jgi:hypothetical protein
MPVMQNITANKLVPKKKKGPKVILTKAASSYCDELMTGLDILKRTKVQGSEINL